MMSFPLEAWTDDAPDMLGPKIKEYVQRIHAQYVSPAYTFFKLPDEKLTTPQPGLSACKLRSSCT